MKTVLTVVLLDLLIAVAGFSQWAPLPERLSINSSHEFVDGKLNKSIIECLGGC